MAVSTEPTTLQQALRQKIDTIKDFTFIEDGKRITPVVLLKQAAGTAEKFSRQTDELLKLGLRCHELVKERHVPPRNGENATAELFKLAKKDWYDRVFGAKNAYGRRPKEIPKSIQVYFSTILRGLEQGVIPGERYKFLPIVKHGKAVTKAERVEIDSFNKLKKAIANKARRQGGLFAGSERPKRVRPRSRRVERGLDAAMGELDLPHLRRLISQFTYLIQEHVEQDSESSRMVLASAISQFGEVVNSLRQSLPDYQRAKNKRELKLQATRQLRRAVREVCRSPRG